MLINRLISIKIIVFFTFFMCATLSAGSLTESCLNSSAIGPNCKFYSCIEDKKMCGKDGYALGYGKQYCNKFTDEDRFSAQGKKWRDQTLICLQEKLVPILFDDNVNCADIKTTAFDTHVGCYTNNGGISVCDLSKEDKSIILGIIKSDLVTYQGMKQVILTGLFCLSN